MEEIQLTSFQKDIYSIIDSIVHSHKPVMISDKGKNLVKIVPINYPEPDSWLGCMRGKGKIVGDIVHFQPRLSIISLRYPTCWAYLSRL